MPRRMHLPAPFRPVFSRVRIQKRLKQMAREIAHAVPPAERPIAIVVLQGAFIFAADLLRYLPSDYPVEIVFLRCQSYGANTYSSGHVLLLQDIEPGIDLRGRTVLLIDDILDSGLTLRFLMAHLQRRGAGKICPCVLLQRSKRVRNCGIKADFAGFKTGPEFFVGYGLDYDGKFRHLPDIVALKRRPKLSKQIPTVPARRKHGRSKC
jgi:hypoxanthine phosphoribosyltransferase